MAQPPAVVARTFKAVGQVQLHHLGERARFHCVRCGQDKTAYHVAKKKKKKKKKKKRRELWHQLPGLGSLLAFFRAAGVHVEVVRGRCLWINGSQTQPLAHLPPSETLEWNSIVNEIALKYRFASFGTAQADGATAQAWLQTGESYAFTAAASIRAVEETFARSLRGAFSPAAAFGYDFAFTIRNTSRIDTIPAQAPPFAGHPG
jgi:hypothetical protein